MKILLYGDIPPTHDLTAGLVLDRLCRFTPRESVVCFAAMNRHIRVEPAEDMHWLPVYYIDKPDEYNPRRFARWPWFSDLWASWVETWRRKVQGGKILKKAYRFGRRHRVDAVLAVLQGQTIINTALPLAKALNVPLYTLVWDPFSWWVKGHGMDPRTAALTARNFDRAVMASEACATASWAMAEHYEQAYGVRSTPVIASHEASAVHRPPTHLFDADRITIGMAGQFYASEEWRQMIVALENAGWKIAGRDVHLVTMGSVPPPADIPKDRLTFLGWQSQPDMIAALAQCDILYCPYPFSEAMSEVSQLSFPSKLVAYFAAGRPVVFHGPPQSSPGRYVAEHQAGVCVDTPYASSVYNALYSLVTQPDLFSAMAANGQSAFQRDFTLERMRENYYTFLGLTDDRVTFDFTYEDSAEPEDDREVARVKWTVRRVLRLLVGWIPPIPQRRIAALEARVVELETWSTIQAEELSGFYAHVARQDELSRAKAEQAKTADPALTEH